MAVALYVLAMVAVVVGVDILFLRHEFWPRLASNVGIVLVFVAFYFRFLKRLRARDRSCRATFSGESPVIPRARGGAASLLSGRYAIGNLTAPGPGGKVQ